MKIITRLFLFITLLGFNAQLFASAYEKEIKDYATTFKTANDYAINARLGELSWKGISDERVFDPLLNLYNESKALDTKRSAKKTSTLAKALSYSGNKKYRAVIEKDLEITTNRRLKKHYQKYLKSFDEFAIWNKIISKGVSKAKSPDQQRTINMVTSDLTYLVRLGAKRMNHFIDDKKMMEVTKKRILAGYKTAESRDEVNAFAYLCKALAASGNSVYKPVIEKVAMDANSKKLQKYAQKYLKQYY